MQEKKQIFNSQEDIQAENPTINQIKILNGQQSENTKIQEQPFSFKQFAYLHAKKIGALIIVAASLMIILIVFLLQQTQWLQSKESNNYTYDLVLLQDPSAICLDGTPGSYYISRKGDPKKFLVVFQDGGWCGEVDIPGTLQNCYQRSKTNFGSSSALKKGYQQAGMQGIFSSDQKNYFGTWTRVKLSYCDGVGHQGSKKDPVHYKDTKLYFRGHNITIAQLKSLQKHNKLFSKATDIVVSGYSAGGASAYMWVNYIKEKAKKAQVSLLVDGVFLDSKNVTNNQQTFGKKFQTIFQLSNIQIDPPTPQCVLEFTDQTFKCMFIKNIYQHVQVPIFNVQSLYDTWSIKYIKGINCVQFGNKKTLENCSTDQRTAIQQFHQDTRQLLLQIYDSSQKNGLWAPVCADHCYISSNSRYFSADYEIPQDSIFSAAESIKRWMQKTPESHKHIDETMWPDNSPCSGQ